MLFSNLIDTVGRSTQENQRESDLGGGNINAELASGEAVRIESQVISWLFTHYDNLCVCAKNEILIKNKLSKPRLRWLINNLAGISSRCYFRHSVLLPLSICNSAYVSDLAVLLNSRKNIMA